MTFGGVVSTAQNQPATSDQLVDPPAQLFDRISLIILGMWASTPSGRVYLTQEQLIAELCTALVCIWGVFGIQKFGDLCIKLLSILVG